MQKKIIALAVAAAFAPALAMADTANVTIYGQVDASYDFVTTGDGVPAIAATKGVTTRRVSSNASRLGLKGSDDLGGGITAVWQAEGTIGFGSAVKPQYTSATALSGPSAFTLDRDTFAGLSSATMGTVLIGRHDTPYKMATRRLDVFADSIADNRSLMGGKGVSTTNLQLILNTSGPTAAQNQISSVASFDGRQGDVLAYVSPSFSGVTVVAALVDLTAQNSQDNNNQHKVTATSLAVMYDVAPFYGSVAHESHKITYATSWNRPDITESANKLGFGYTTDQFSVGLAYEKTTDDAAAQTWIPGTGSLLGHTAMSLNGKFNISATDSVKAAYTKAGKLGDSVNGNTDTGAKQISLGYDHSMSKRTTVYAIYTKLSNEKNVSYGLNGSDNYNNAYVSGASPSAISFGVKQVF